MSLNDKTITALYEDLRNILHLPSDIEIFLDVTDDLPYDISGYCYRTNSRSYYIAINLLKSPKEIVETLCHEMRHIHQFYFGDYEQYEMSFRWKGIVYSFSDFPIGAHPHERNANTFTRQIRHSIYQKIKEIQILPLDKSVEG